MGKLRREGPPPDKFRITLTAGKNDADIRDWMWLHPREAQARIKWLIRTYEIGGASAIRANGIAPAAQEHADSPSQRPTPAPAPAMEHTVRPPQPASGNPSHAAPPPGGQREPVQPARGAEPARPSQSGGAVANDRPLKASENQAMRRVQDLIHGIGGPS